MALKQSLLQLLSSMLSPIAEIRLIAEERMKALEVTDDYGSQLFDIVMDIDESAEERQLAALVLRTFVRDNWISSSLAEVDPVITKATKEKLRATLPFGLCIVNRTIKNVIATTLASIATYDFPEQWPNMLEALPWPTPGDDNKALAVLEFLKEWNGMIEDHQVNACVSVIFSNLFEILNDSAYCIDARCKAICMFVHYLSASKPCNDVQTGLAMEKLLAAFAPYINRENYTDVNLELLSEIVKALASLLVDHPFEATNCINPSLSSIWNMLTAFSGHYQVILANSDANLHSTCERTDEITENFFDLIFNMFELIKCLVEDPANADSLLGVLSDIVWFSILFMAPNARMQEIWMIDPLLFFRDESHPWNEMSLRHTARDVFQEIFVKLGDSVGVIALGRSIVKYTTVDQGFSYNWRINEAVMYALSSVRHIIVKHAGDLEAHGFNVVQYLTVWGSKLDVPLDTFLLARILLMGAKLSTLLNEENMLKYFTATVDWLKAGTMVLRHAAVKALRSHILQIQCSPLRQMYLQFKLKIVEGLLCTLLHFDEELYHTVFVTLNEFLKLDGCNDDQTHVAIVPFIFQLFFKPLSNIRDMGSCEPVIRTICITSSGYIRVESTILPTLINIIETIGKSTGEAVPRYSYEYQINALQILWSLTYYTCSPLSLELITKSFRTVYNCFLNNTDSVIVDLTAGCLRNFILRSSAEIFRLFESEFYPGVLNLINHILNAQDSASISKPVVKLCIVSIKTLGLHMEEHIESFVKQMLINISTSISLEIPDNNMLMFAFLFKARMETMLRFLTSIPGPNGESALAGILQTWFSRDISFEDTYERNLNIQAIARLLEHVLLTQDERLTTIQVLSKDEDNDPGTQMPAPVRMLKSLIRAVGTELDIIHGTEGLMEQELESPSDSDDESKLIQGAPFDQETGMDRYEDVFVLDVQVFLKVFFLNHLDRLAASSYLGSLNDREINIFRSVTDT